MLDDAVGAARGVAGGVLLCGVSRELRMWSSDYSL